jgi:MFS family permease
MRTLRESRNEEHEGADLPGLVTWTGALFALVLGLFRGADWGWSSGRVVGLFAAAAVLLAAFVAIELRSRAPMLDVRLFRVPTFTGAQITAFSMSSGMFAQFLFLPLYLENVLGYSAVKTGVVFLPLSLVSFVVAPIAGRLSTRIPVRILLGGGLAVIGVALLLMHGITLGSTWTTLLAGFIVGGVGIGLVNAPLASTSVSVVEPRRAGMASGINNTFRQVGIATGIAALGAIFQSQITSQVQASSIPERFVQPFSKGISAGATQQALDAVPAPLRPRAETLAHSAFISGLNTILLVSAVVLFVGAILAFVLVRQQDFVESSAEAAAASG